MIYSMTGYGLAAAAEHGPIEVELRSVNNRFLKVTTKAPEFLGPLQREVDAFLRGRLARGTVICSVNTPADIQPESCTIRADVAERYFKEIDALRGRLGVKEPVGLDTVLGLPGVVSVESLKPDEGFRRAVMGTVGRALSALLAMRAAEGEKIAGFIRKHMKTIEGLLDRVEEGVPDMVAAYRDRLAERVRILLAGREAELNGQDLLREVSVFAERSDISEEMERMRSHLGELSGTLDAGGAVGRKLDFIAQELFREANTMASKASAVRLAKDILEIKVEVDRIREQVQNIE